MNKDITFKAIAANIAALGDLLDDAQLRVSEANKAISEDQQNQAIGCMFDLDCRLQDALALYRASIALHRRPS